MKKIHIYFALALVLGLGVAASAFATVGVGVGSGKITVNDLLKPGTIYELPSIPVLNTGDETANYGVSIEYNEVQPQMKPASEWFHFTPEKFSLEPGKSQIVKINLAVPVKAIPGEYFAYLEAHPVKADIAGVTTIGVAAASKLYFTVSPANFIEGLYYRTKSLIVRGAPYTYIGFGLIGLWLLVKIFRKFFNFKIAIAVKK